MTEMPISYKLLSPEAKPPVRQYPEDAGADIFCAKHFIIAPGQIMPIGCGISIYIPKGMFGLVTGKSGLSSQGLIVIPGIMDCGYTGEIRAIVYNASEKPMAFKAGNAIAQIIILEMVASYNFQVIQKGKRQDNGFGSTGKEKEE